MDDFVYVSERGYVAQEFISICISFKGSKEFEPLIYQVEGRTFCLKLQCYVN